MLSDISPLGALKPPYTATSMLAAIVNLPPTGKLMLAPDCTWTLWPLTPIETAAAREASSSTSFARARSVSPSPIKPVVGNSYWVNFEPNL